MYKTNDPQQVKLLTSNADYYGSVVELSNIGNNFKFVKEHTEECKVDSSIIVKDLSLTVKAFAEDEAFAFVPELWINFRRGNTFLQIYDPRDYENLVQTLIGRKGLNKFFDLQREFITPDGRYREDYLDRYESNIKNMILGPIKKSLLEGHKVEILKTLKANGENTQISYNPETELWVIASKNVSVVARDEADLDKYP